ncbi:phage tail protein [Paradesertivirga mongoliensis]|uniref:Phage tail protein n=1 Tax=Paradesertivirga mongoliensis TaxID=2100740 RepID=A0ABW4ZN31_9SPHI|nr:phage tail protein [Pedobacter mongoliensis]
MAKAPVAGGYYPPVGFHFKVEFVGIGNDNDIRFQSVAGLTVEYDTESFKEGGENRFEHKLPLRTKYPDLSLKRGMLTDSKVIKWCLDALQNREFKPAQINVILLNEEHQPLKTWNVYNAWPKKWSVSDLNAQDNSIVIETLELSYNYFTVN